VLKIGDENVDEKRILLWKTCLFLIKIII